VAAIPTGTARADLPQEPELGDEEAEAVPMEKNKSWRHRLTTTGISQTIVVTLFVTEIGYLCPVWLMPETQSNGLLRTKKIKRKP